MKEPKTLQQSLQDWMNRKPSQVKRETHNYRKHPKGLNPNYTVLPSGAIETDRYVVDNRKNK